ncbi:MAG: GTP-binding protein, partial [Candidatus Micrarchaeia archaeon]
VVKEAIESMKEGSVFIADSLSSLLSKYDEGILEGISYWIENAKGKRITTIFLFTNWNYPQDRINRIARMFDYVVNLKTVEEKVLLRNYFSVVKAPKEVLNANVPFRIGMDGISIYIPKILVTGPFHSGKSTFIHKVSVRAVSVDRMGTTIALDHGYIDYGGLTADLFGTPGQERFDFMLDILNKDTFGVVCIVDSTNPGTFQRAKEMIEQVAGYGLPYVIAANKQDLEGALTPEQVRAEMGLPENIPVMPTVATTGEGCVECVKKLIDLIVTQ